MGFGVEVRISERLLASAFASWDAKTAITLFPKRGEVRTLARSSASKALYCCKTRLTAMSFTFSAFASKRTRSKSPRFVMSASM